MRGAGRGNGRVLSGTPPPVTVVPLILYSMLMRHNNLLQSDSIATQHVNENGGVRMADRKFGTVSFRCVDARNTAARFNVSVFHLRSGSGNMAGAGARAVATSPTLQRQRVSLDPSVRDEAAAKQGSLRVQTTLWTPCGCSNGRRWRMAQL